MSHVLLLLLSALAVFVGPALHFAGARSRALRELVDGFALVVVTGVCLLAVLPHVVAHLGLAGLLLAAVGLMGPMFAHRIGSRPRWTLAFFSIALIVHVLLDGAVLSLHGGSHGLGWAVVAHRLPVGFAIVFATRGLRRPTRATWGVACAIVLTTIVGFLLGPPIVASLPEAGAVGLEAIVAGMLLHVVVVPHRAEHGDHAHCSGECATTHAHHEHAHHDHAHHEHAHHDHAHHDHAHHDHAHHEHAHHDHAHHDHAHHDHAHLDQLHRHAPPARQTWAAMGALLAAGLIVTGALLGDGAVESSVPVFLRTLGVLLLESAPALLVGYALAGVVPFLLTPTRTAALGRGGRLAQSLRGVAFGLPLPVCSCGVLPLYESLIRRGAPPAAAMAFFVATPELGLDAVLLSVPLLGSSLTIARVAAAFAVAVLVALVVRTRPAAAPEQATDAVGETARESLASRIRSGLRFGFVEVFDHTMPWIALGLVIAAVAEPMLSHGAIASIPPALQVPLAALVGVPVYVCASGATPVAALAIHKGLSSGAAVAFLIAGPATNVTTFGVLARLHGRRIAVAFGVAVTVLAVIAGWVVDLVGVPAANVLATHAHVDSHGSAFAWLALAGLAVLTVASLARQGPRGALRQILAPIHSH